MAGILFTDGKFVLAGINYLEDICGFGGKKIATETPVITAIREVLEELFEIKPTYQLIDIIIDKIEFDNLISRDNYSMFVMNFHDLETICDAVMKSCIKSAVYDQIPLNAFDLMMNRKGGKEIKEVFLLPACINLDFDGCFMNDIYAFKTCT
jgi:hypothetical protein